MRDERGDEHGELHYDPTGRLHPKMRATAGSTRQLFPPPELIGEQELGAQRSLWLVEGEPDAIRLWSLGLPAVAVPGAGNWRDEWAPRFTGQHWRVTVCFDCDEPGRAGATRAAAAIVNAGGDARIVDLDPARDDGYDLSDWTSSATSAELRPQAAAALQAIADAVPLYEPGPAAGGRPWRSVPWSTFRDEAPPAHRWLVDGLLPEGALCFVAGPPKRGKTWIGITVAIALALGHPFAGEHPVPGPRDVLYAALEGSQTGLRTRIGALARGAGVDPDSDELERLHMLYRPRPFDLAELATADWLFEEADDVDAALIVIDVLRAAARFQENAAEDFARIRDHLAPLLDAGRTVALLHHFGKLNDTQKERSPGERMAGTGAMYGALDVGFLITRSEESATRLGVTIEARDFAAPERLDLAIVGDGSGKHGGFTYADTATLEVDVPDEVDYAASAETYLRDERDGLSRDALATALGAGYKVFEPELAADAERRTALGEEPLIVRWDPARDGRFPGVDERGRRRQPSYAPFLTFTHYRQARTGAGPSHPNLLEQGGKLGPERLGPPSGGGPRADRASLDELASGGDEIERSEP